MPRRSLLWPDPRVKPPFGAVEIDGGHRLALGLVDLWIFNEGGGLAANLAKPHRALRPTGSPSWLAGAEGAAVNFTGGSDYFSAPESNDADYIGDITLVWRGVARGTSRWQQLLSKNTSASTNNPFEFRNQFSANLVLDRADSGVSEWATTGNPIVSDVLKTYAVTHVAGSGNATFYGNAVAETVATSARTAAGSGADLRLGYAVDGAKTFDGYCSLALIAKRVWAPQDMEQMVAEPWGLVRPIVRRHYSVPSGPTIIETTGTSAGTSAVTG